MTPAEFLRWRRQDTGENRREQRHRVDQPVEIFSPSNPGKTWQAQLYDISSGGMQLVLDAPPSIGPEIRIRWNDREVRGTIRHNRRFDTGQYRLGVELSSSCESLLIEMLGCRLQEAQFSGQHQASLDRVMALLDMVSEAIVITSNTGAIVFWSAGAERLYGYTREEAMGKEFRRLVEAPYVLSVNPEGVFSFRRKDGSRVSVMTRSVTQPETFDLPEVVVWIQQKAGLSSIPVPPSLPSRP